MDALKAIPQLFFDVFARIIPGLVALVVLHGNGIMRWDRVLSLLAGEQLRDSNAFGFAVLAALTGAFVIGHLLSPIAKALEAAATFYSEIFREGLNDAFKDSAFKPRKGVEIDWVKYDWLRVKKPDAGALAVRIRAEYTMYFSLSAVFLAAVLGPDFNSIHFVIPWRFVFVAAALVLMMRAHQTKQTFAKSVVNLYTVSPGLGK
jgi:hypothetical protein